MKRLALLTVLAATLPASGGVLADTLVGRNGDRISGHVVAENGGRIVFQSDLFGRLELPADQAHIERDPIAAQPAPAPASPTPAANTAGPADAARWSADLGAKLGLDRGSLKSSEDRLDSRMTFTRRTDRGEMHGSFAYKYKRTEGELRDDDWLASIGYDRFVSERRFNAARLMARRELAEDSYDSTRTLSLATGWRLMETPKHYLRVGPALGYLAMTRGGQSFDGAALGIYARGMTPLVGRSQLTGELQFLDALGNGRYGNLEVRVRHPLTERLFISLGWDYQWSDFDIESGFSSEWRWDIGWRFGATGNP